METFRSGCLICGGELVYFKQPQKLKCEFCGQENEAEAACVQRHYVCDHCHRRAAFESISAEAKASTLRDPLAIARKMMAHPSVNMHGPEHHYLVAAALLAAYVNSGGKLDLEKALSQARQRAEKVPGGICGLWGCCGAAVASGIFVSLATGASPLSGEEWSLANQMTSESLAVISRHGGPRCCKRDSFLAIRAAADFCAKHLGVKMEESGETVCSFFSMNPSCRKSDCLFFPG